MYFLILFVLPALTKASYVITVYGDVLKDKQFFTETYPWIIDNIGGDISAEYYLLGSGRYSVPQMCALSQLKSNTYLQAEFLKCEASDTKSEICLCNSGINPQIFRQCVQSSGSKAGEASFKYNQLGIEASPIIEMGPKSYAFGKSNEDYLKSLCTIFGDDKPRGCMKWNCCANSTEFIETRAVAHFDCDKIQNHDSSISINSINTKCSPIENPTFDTGYPSYTTEYTTTEYTTTEYTTDADHEYSTAAAAPSNYRPRRYRTTTDEQGGKWILGL